MSKMNAESNQINIGNPDCPPWLLGEVAWQSFNPSHCESAKVTHMR